MALALDTNLLLYAHIGQFPQHAAARRFLESVLENDSPYCLSWQVYYEYIRVVSHPKVLKTPLSVQQAINDLKPYVADPRCQILVETEGHTAVFEALMRRLPSSKGNFIHDCHYAALLKEHGVTRIATADMDFRKFDFLEVVDPLAS